MDAVSQSVHTAFRKLRSSADELLNNLVKNRAEAARAHQSGSAFDWKAAAEELEMLESGFAFYLEPAKPALEKATPGKTLTIAEVDASTALHALQRLSRKSIKMFWCCLSMTQKGSKRLVITPEQKAVFDETGLLASITALTQAKLRDLRRHVEREIADAQEVALADYARHPGQVAYVRYAESLYKRYSSNIGFDAVLAEKPKRKTKRPAHRPPDTDAKSDAAVGDAWLRGRNSGQFVTYRDVADVLKQDVAEVKEALDRDRHRRRDVWAANKRKRRKK